ncbi:MAG: hypothetical protein OEU92_23015 [Alphaproteobacteria bacterium]|nr:hypothetical protein [Alphaproteobacteria bacterium]
MKGALAWHADRYGSEASEQPLDIMLYFNGGLNSKNAVLTTAFDRYQHVLEDGVYPIYMTWPTGAFDTYVEDWLHVRAGRYTSTFDWATFASVPVRPLNDLLLGVAATPAAWTTSAVEIGRSTFDSGASGFRVRKDSDLRPKSPAPNGQLRIEIDNNLLFDDAVDEPRRGSLPSTIADQTLYLGLTPVRLITTPAIGPGFALWRNMVRRTRTAIRDRREFPDESDVSIGNGDDIDCKEDYDSGRYQRQKCHPKGSGAFGQFFHWLEACLDDSDDCPLAGDEHERLKKGLRLTLIGRSMGTIVINEAVAAFPDLPYGDIVYMAGAASVRDTADALSPVLQDRQGCTRFFNLMLHPLNDSLERTAGGALLSGSLLTYIDEYLELPKTLPDRTIGQWRNLRLTRHLFPPEARRWSLYRVFDRHAKPTKLDDGTEALEWNPIKHGSFNDKNMPFWEESFRKPENYTFDDPPTCPWDLKDETDRPKT